MVCVGITDHVAEVGGSMSRAILVNNPSISCPSEYSQSRWINGKCGMSEINEPYHPPTDPSVPPPLVDASTLARRYMVTSKTVRNWARDGRIPTALAVGRVIRFDADAVEKALLK